MFYTWLFSVISVENFYYSLHIYTSTPLHFVTKYPPKA